MGKQIWKPGTVLYPVPVIMASVGDFDKSETNIITIAWTGILSSEKPMTYISVRKERASHQIIKNTMDFVINLVNEKLVYETDFAGVKSGNDIDKFKTLNLTPFKSQIVKAPSIYESPVNIECQVKQIIELGSHDMFLSEIVSVSVSDEYIDESGKFNLNASNPVCYSHGEYFAIGKKLGKFGYSVKKKK